MRQILPCPGAPAAPATCPAFLPREVEEEESEREREEEGKVVRSVHKTGHGGRRRGRQGDGRPDDPAGRRASERPGGRSYPMYKE